MRITAAQFREMTAKKGAKRANPAEDLLKSTVIRLARMYGHSAEAEHAPIEGRRFRVDVAIPELKLGFECDGWQYHAKHKDAWLKEKKRDRIFLMHGWRVFRFAASEILNRTAELEIKDILEIHENERVPRLA